MEADTRRLLVEQEKERNKAIADTQIEHDAMIRAENEEVQRKNIGVQRIGSIEKSERERYQIYARDLEYMTSAEIEERNRLRLGDQRGHKKTVSPYTTSASPQKDFKRRLK